MDKEYRTFVRYFCCLLIAKIADIFVMSDGFTAQGAFVVGVYQ